VAWGKPHITVIKNNRQVEYQIPEQIQKNSQFGSICPDGKTIYFFYGDIIAKLNDDGSFIVKKMPSIVLSLNFKDGFLYAGALNEGLFIFDDAKFPNAPLNSFKGRSISCSLFDNEGGLWITSTDKGVFYIKNHLLKHVLTDKENQPDISYSTRFLNDSSLMYATQNGLFSIVNGEHKPFLKEKNSKIVKIVFFEKNKMSCFGSFANYYSKIFYKLPYNIKSCMLANNPTMHTIFYNGYYISPTSLDIQKVKTAYYNYENYHGVSDSALFPAKVVSKNTGRVFLDNVATIWGGMSDGLYKSLPPHDTMLLANNSSLLSNGIDFITQLKNNLLAIGTRPGIIVVMNKEKIIGTVSEKDGLIPSKIRFMLPVNDKLWVATQLGITVIEFTSYNPLTCTITNIDKKDGLFNLTINHLLDFKNDVIASTNNGFYYIDKSLAFVKKTPPEIPFSISNISYYKGDVSNISSITLPYSANRAIIKYRAVCFNSFESIQYRYRFTSGDTVWHNTTSNELVLENLEPGNYTLEVKAVIPAQQRSSQMQTLSIIVLKPWWQNNWFRSFCVLSASLTLYYIVKTRIKKIKTEEERKTALNAKLAELEQTALRSQMNPHFIFNCLTSIQQLIISGNKTDANEYLVKFSRLIRKTLEMSAIPFISIREEKNYLEEYISLEQLRLTGKFDFNITVDSALNMDETLIPNMMMQPVVENCIRHGIKSLEGRKGMIKINFTPGNNTITCSVTDNGVGRKSISPFEENTFSKHKSYGMDIVSKRLEALREFGSKKDAPVINDLFDNNGQPAGTEVILHLPYKKAL
jgi:two-component sensor histidine kinase